MDSVNCSVGAVSGLLVLNSSVQDAVKINFSPRQKAVMSKESRRWHFQQQGGTCVSGKPGLGSTVRKDSGKNVYILT